MSLDQLDREDRLRLIRFVCSFAWADLDIQESERGFVAELVRQFKLDEAEREQVEEWLRLPPAPEEVDPADIPRAHRELFLEAARQIVLVDDHVDETESETFELFAQLLAGDE